MVTPVSVTFVTDRRCSQPELLIVTVPRGTQVPEAHALKDALGKVWPTREIRVFEAPNLEQARLA